MNLLDIVARAAQPQPWEEGDNIPWNDPAFSARMLREHLSQEHDAASRRSGIIARQVAWIHETLLAGVPSRILDLGCGPGLYANALARLGHNCIGVDYSPASIAHARQTAEAEGLHCAFLEADLRQATFGWQYDLAMLIYGEFNVFAPEPARALIRKVSKALRPGGLLLLEPHPFAEVKKIGQRGRSWYSSPSGLFSEQAHLCLEESCWDEEARAATTRYYIVDAASGAVSRHAASYQAYTDAEFISILSRRGFKSARFYASLGELGEEATPGLIAIVARRQD
jgi:SAM-dependent methyltransferase